MTKRHGKSIAKSQEDCANRYAVYMGYAADGPEMGAYHEGWRAADAGKEELDSPPWPALTGEGQAYIAGVKDRRYLDGGMPAETPILEDA